VCEPDCSSVVRDTNMGSMGMLLADWSVELIRNRRKNKGKGKKNKKGEKIEEKVDMVEPRVLVCPDCEGRTPGMGLEDCDTLYKLVGVGPGELVAAVEELVTTAGKLRAEAEQLKEESKQMAENVGSQLVDRDKAHGERVRALEMLMAEKERQLLCSSNVLRQQLAQGKKERDQLQRQLDEKSEYESEGSTRQWEAECESLRQVLDIRRDELEKMKAANNSLRLELERFVGLESQLQVQRQRTEELGLVVALKNDQLRQVLDEYDCVQQQLEVEVSAHLACQQELERSQWVADTILNPDQQSTARDKTWKNISNQKESQSGHILDVVQKGEKGLAYSFNC